MRRYVRSRCSWALLYHSQVPFRPGFSRTVTLFPSKAVRISSKGDGSLGYGDAGWKRPLSALASGCKCRTLKRSRGIHATQLPPPNVAHPKPQSETEQIENHDIPSPVNQPGHRSRNAAKPGTWPGFASHSICSQAFSSGSRRCASTSSRCAAARPWEHPSPRGCNRSSP